MLIEIWNEINNNALRKTKWKGEVPEGDWLNYTVKVTVTWYDQVIIEMFVQHHKLYV